MTLSKQLKQWRSGHLRSASARGKAMFGISQAQAAARLGVSLRTYQDWEQGRHTPQGIALKAVLERIK